MKSPPLWLIATLLSITCSAIGQIVLKLGVTSIRLSPQDLLRPGQLIAALFHPTIIAGIACFVLSMLFWLAALSGKQLSNIYPIAALGYVIITIASVKIFHDQITPAKVIGLTLIVIGISVMQSSLFTPAVQIALEDHAGDHVR